MWKLLFGHKGGHYFSVFVHQQTNAFPRKKKKKKKKKKKLKKLNFGK